MKIDHSRLLRVDAIAERRTDLFRLACRRDLERAELTGHLNRIGRLQKKIEDVRATIKKLVS